MSKVKKIRNVYSVAEHTQGRHMLTTNFQYEWQAREYLAKSIRTWKSDYGFPFDDDNDYVVITKITLNHKVTFSSITFGIIEQSNIKKERIIYDR